MSSSFIKTELCIVNGKVAVLRKNRVYFRFWTFIKCPKLPYRGILFQETGTFLLTMHEALEIYM